MKYMEGIRIIFRNFMDLVICSIIINNNDNKNNEYKMDMEIVYRSTPRLRIEMKNLKTVC